jgi:ATP-binding protein involved in chromosome partitioning
MLTKEQILNELKKIKHPELKRDLVSLMMVKEIQVGENGIEIKLKTPSPDRKLQIGLEAQVRQSLTKLDSSKMKIKFEVDPSMNTDEDNRLPGVKNIIAVGSGKGGVGKSTVTINLAATIAKKGLKVGVLDADIYGPSIGKMIGANGRVAIQTEESTMFPVEKFGIKVMSFGFLVDESQPIVWRGPMLGKAVEQFLYDVSWGELDYLLIDLPPGTGDVQLSLSQYISLSGVVIVTTPQDVATLDASKAVGMFQQVKVPILGIIENMSYFIPPDALEKRYYLFGKGGGEKLAKSVGAPLLGQIPHMIDVMESGDSGTPLVHLDKTGMISKEYDSILEKLDIEIQKWND